MAPHSSTLAWKIPWTEEPGRLQSMGLLRVGHDSVTSLSLFTFMHWRRKWQPTPVFCLENPRNGKAWWAAVYGVAQSWTRLKRLSSSSSSSSIIITHVVTRPALIVCHFLNLLNNTVSLWKPHVLTSTEYSVGKVTFEMTENQLGISPGEHNNQIFSVFISTM